MSKQYREDNCEVCNGVMELVEFTPREWVGTAPRKGGGYRNVYRASGAKEVHWQCLNDFAHKVIVA